MTLRPLFDRILVRRLDEAPKEKSLIVLPDAAKEKPTRGLVVATGPGLPVDVKASNPDDVEDALLTRPMSVKVGDVVWFGRHTGHEIEADGEKLLVMREEDVFAVEDHVA